MIKHGNRCSDDRLRSLLHTEDDGDETKLCAEHIDECPRCQARLEQLAAEPAEWRDARDSLLSGDEGDAAGQDAIGDRPWAQHRWQRHPAAWTESMSRQLLSPPSHPEMLGRIGRYEVERLIGSGGMGVVFKAFDTELNRPVAVKVLAPFLAGSGAARKRFAREARAAAAVVHEHVVSIHNVETEGESPFLVMQYVAGESLQGRIDREGPLDVCEILRIGLQTAAGLAAAHAQGLVHRDVKPSNILLEKGVERALLTDFGLARASDDASLTHTGYHPGTPQYMSPEQARGEPLDQRSDLFSLGSVLYAICTGRPPFRAETTYGVIRRITDNEPVPIRDINPDVPDWLCAIIAKLMSKHASDRYQSAAEVAELLEQCLAHVQQPMTVPLPKSVASLVAHRDGRPPLVRFLVAAGFAFSLLLVGVLIVLELNKGKLTIQCEVDDVPIRIMQGDDVVEHLTVSKSGKTVRIAAGRYQVEVEGNIDGIVVEGGTVSLTRGGVETVKIVRSADTSNSGHPEKSVLLAARRLVAQLRNAQLRRKLLVETLGEHHPEVLKLDAEIKAIEESIARSADVPLIDPSAQIVPLNDLQTKGQRLVQVDRLRVAGNFDLAGRSPREFIGGKAEAVVEDDQRTKTSLEGTVTYINPVATADGKFRIWATVENRQIDGKWLLVPGELAKLTIHAADSRGHSPGTGNAEDLPPSESNGLYRFPTELEGKWQIIDAKTGGLAKDAYIGQVAEISGSALVLRSNTASNTYHLTFVEPRDEQIALDLTAYPPNNGEDQPITFRCLMKISDDGILRLCRPQNSRASRPRDLDSPDRSDTVFTFVRDESDFQRRSAEKWWRRPESWLRKEASEGQGANHGDVQNAEQEDVPATAEISPRWQRWEIRYPSDPKQFARFLDFFGIELGVPGGGSNDVTYLSKVSEASSAVRHGLGISETRLYLNKADGESIRIAKSLMEQAGIETRDRVVLWFYPEETEQKLAALESKFAGERPIVLVDKTVFGVRPKADGFEFYVVSQATKPPASQSDRAKVSEAVDSSDSAYTPRSAAEKAVGKLVLVFYQDKSRRAVPCLVLNVGGQCFAVTTGLATRVPDGTALAIDGAWVEWGDNAPVRAEYDSRSTPELFIYRASSVLASGTLDEVTSVQVGNTLSALSVDSLNRLKSVATSVVRMDVERELRSPGQDRDVRYSGLIEIDRSLPEGTPLFRDGKLAGLTLLGSRFIGEQANKSFVVPADRLLALCRRLNGETGSEEPTKRSPSSSDPTAVP